MRLLSAFRETSAERDPQPPTPDPEPAAEPALDRRGREIVRRVADAAAAAHRERVPF